MTDFIILPGSGGSGEAHWQTRWQQANSAMRRFSPASWDLPDFDDWVAALETAVSQATTPPVLIAHSLSCLLVAHWQTVSGLEIAGAFLVAVPDPASPAYPAYAIPFAETPRGPLRFPSLIVASTDDSLRYARLCQGEGCAMGQRAAHRRAARPYQQRQRPRRLAARNGAAYGFRERDTGRRPGTRDRTVGARTGRRALPRLVVPAISREGRL